MKLGYLLNFGEVLMKNGIARVINGTIEAAPSLHASAPREEL
jgi:hypothetical protein